MIRKTRRNGDTFWRTNKTIFFQNCQKKKESFDIFLNDRKHQQDCSWIKQWFFSLDNAWDLGVTVHCKICRLCLPSCHTFSALSPTHEKADWKQGKGNNRLSVALLVDHNTCKWFYRIKLFCLCTYAARTEIQIYCLWYISTQYRKEGIVPWCGPRQTVTCMVIQNARVSLARLLLIL